VSVVIVVASAGLACVAAGVVVGHVATRWGTARQLEVFADRKDTAIDAALGTAFELQRISGEHPEQVELYDQGAEGPFPVDADPDPLAGLAEELIAQQRQRPGLRPPRSLPGGRTYRTRLT
jgi:hypothetical protein